MADRRYDLDVVRALVSHHNVSGRHLIVTFTCPTSRKHVNARHTVPNAPTIASTVARTAQNALWYEMRRTANQMLYSALGHGVAGRVASNAMNTAMSGVPTGASGPRALTAEEQEQALVAAFRSVEREFVWVNERWVHRSAAAQLRTALEQAVEEQPLQAYDKLVLARMAVEIARAHGSISDEERAHLEDALDPSVGSLAALMRKPPLTRAELAEVSPGARKPLLALATAVALCDEQFAKEEVARLDQFAVGMGLSPAEQEEVRTMATTFVLDQWFEKAFAWGGHDEHLREQAVALGAKLGLTRDQVEVAEARFQKRRA